MPLGDINHKSIYLGMATAVSMPPSGVVTVTSHEAGDTNSRIKYKAILYKLGITEIFLGICCIVLCFASVIYAANVTGPVWYYYFIGLTYISPGIWCGIAPLVSGSFGVQAMKNPSVHIYNANMAASIVSAFFSLVLFIMSIMSAAACQYSPLVALHVFLLVIAFALFIINIVHSAYCCAGVCCRNKTQTAVVYNASQPIPNAQYVQLANGQYMLVQNPIIVGQPYPTAPIMPNQPGVLQSAPVPSATYVTPQGPAPAYPPMNPTKEQQANVTQMPPQVSNQIPPPYNG